MRKQRRNEQQQCHSATTLPHPSHTPTRHWWGRGARPNIARAAATNGSATPSVPLPSYTPLPQALTWQQQHNKYTTGRANGLSLAPWHPPPHKTLPHHLLHKSRRERGGGLQAHTDVHTWHPACHVYIIMYTQYTQDIQLQSCACNHVYINS